MQHSAFLLLFVSFMAQAQAPVEDRQVLDSTHKQAQQKADYARQEKDKAGDRVGQADQDLQEAQRAQVAVEKQFEAAKQRSATAQKILEKAQADLAQATARVTHTEAEAAQSWRK